MGELEEKINKLLSSPDGLNQVKAMAQKLSEQGAGSSELGALLPALASAPGKAPDREDNPPGIPADGIAALGAALPQLMNMDINTLTSLAGLMGVKAGNGKNAALLNSIKPYLKEKRHERIDRAVQMVKLAELARGAFGNLSGGDG